MRVIEEHGDLRKESSYGLFPYTVLDDWSLSTRHSKYSVRQKVKFKYYLDNF
jgi:hypothetical protein